MRIRPIPEPVVFVGTDPRQVAPSFMSHLCDGHAERLSPRLQWLRGLSRKLPVVKRLMENPISDPPAGCSAQCGLRFRRYERYDPSRLSLQPESMHRSIGTEPPSPLPCSRGSSCKTKQSITVSGASMPRSPGSIRRLAGGHRGACEVPRSGFLHVCIIAEALIESLGGGFWVPGE